MDEAISRQSVIDMLDETKRIARQNIDGAVLMTFERVFDSLVNITNALPTIQPAEPKRGRWEMGMDERFVECSECGLMTTRNELRGLAVFGKNEPNFCPNCGCRMDGGE